MTDANARETEVARRPVRRIVTGHDAEGRAVVVSDTARAPVQLRGGSFGFHSVELWRTNGTPVPIFAIEEEPADGPRRQLPAPAGSVFRLNIFMPEQQSSMSIADRQEAFASLGSTATVDVTAQARHPMIHRTETVDYTIVLSGRITMILDQTEVELQTGDIVIQRGTNHAWSNKSAEPCLVAFIMLGGQFSADLNRLLER